MLSSILYSVVLHLKTKVFNYFLMVLLTILPAPTDIPAIKGVVPDTEEEVERQADDKEPFSALAFKVMTDPYRW